MRKSLIKGMVIFAMMIWMATNVVAITSGHTGTSVKPATFPPVHADIFFDGQNLSPVTVPEVIPADQKITGAVVPHHLLAGKLIQEIFVSLERETPSTIIVIGPNHDNAGGEALTSTWGWQTPFGVVEADQDLIERLIQLYPLREDNETCSNEHSLGNIMPFIKYYLPQAKVVPIILHHDLSLEEANTLGTLIAEEAGEGTVVVASVDFSHYLTRQEAEEKDKETLEALRQGNMGQIFSFGNDYLDSPPSLGVLFSAMKKWEIIDFTVVKNTNSGEILKNDQIETTSYFTMVFTK
ncbi:MAG: AmmeMemoRadiSam system protein B [Desulfitobacteriaceae bacterium]|nr:AmmeMemoRadiSam system protein B [Desulfitobacteriaceae bacterium]MDD4752142.1 AmmeMemoRadiSam system protein B [Desulfitobacteriaceae bacterium]